MTELSGYVLEPLREDADFALYRGRQHGNPSTVLAIAVSAKQPSLQNLQRLEHEYSLAAGLDSGWAAKPLALTRHEGKTVLILTDPGREPLDQVLEKDKEQPLDLTRFLRIAIGLTKAISHVHRRGLIHKDIKPANVLVEDNSNVWLTGFGIASQVPREHQSPVPLQIIAGTLAYMAPEQTGRMNRSIDARCDLYSLGVTLYQMLTGALPFAAADPLEWVHCHIARQPASLGERAAVPEPLSSLTMGELWVCRRRGTRSSMRLLLPSPTAPAWDFASAALSLNRKAGACGLPLTLRAAPTSIFTLPLTHRHRNDDYR